MTQTLPATVAPSHSATHTHTHIIVKGLGSHESVDGVIHLLSEAHASLQSEQETKSIKNNE